MNEDGTPSTEAEAIAALVPRPFVELNFADLDRAVAVALPPEWTESITDLEEFSPEPRRQRGTIVVHDAPGFIQAVRQRNHEERYVALYGDEEKMALTAILNDDVNNVAGWRDNRVTLGLRRRPEWETWLANDGKLLEQTLFAEFIESALLEIVDPSAAVMLDLAQTFNAHTAADFRSSNRLANGATQFRYEENIDAQAGVNGEITIPEQLELSIAPFFGSEKFQVFARFRFVLRAGDLALGYKLTRPADVERGAFSIIADRVAEELPATLIAGVAPESRS